MTKLPSKLVDLKPEIIHGGLRFCFYGPEAVGKSTLAAHAPKPVFSDVEAGTAQLHATRYPYRPGEDGGFQPRTLTEIYDSIDDLHYNDHDFKSFAIDTIDALETLIYQHILDRDSGVKSMLNQKGKDLTSVESYGYGKGFGVALDEWRKLIARLDKLRLHRGMNIILLGHTQVKKFHNPDGEDWDRYQLRVQDTEKASVAGLLKGWVDVLGFCTYEQGAGRLDEGQAKAKGWSTGRRLVKLERTAAYDAKSRIVMPAEIELRVDDPWTPFAEALKAGRELSAEDLVELLRDEVKNCDDVTTKKVAIAVKNAKGNVATLSRYLNNLKRRNAEKENENE